MIYGYVPRTFIRNRDGASAKLAQTLIKCGADITAIQEMRWIRQGCKIRKTAISTTAAMRTGANSAVGSWLAEAFDTLSQISLR